MLLAALAGPALACGDSLGSGARRIEDPGFVLVYRLQPEPVPVGRHFAIDFALCARAGTPLPAEVRVDATMPEHQHGMNYRPSVAARGAGLYRAEGLMFHMPGRWQFVFEVGDGRRADRVTADETLK
jgi:YtkA-like